MVVVSHDLFQVRELCTRAIWLEHGRVREEGPVEQITYAYEASALAAT
jgi:ABC-type polysaccharide/polyol phosphate transport system ATPase subunit